MNKKVFIEITGGRHFSKSVPGKGGQEFTDVSIEGSNYGSGSPCSTEDEVCQAIKHCREFAICEGDRPVVRDMRARQMTLQDIMKAPAVCPGRVG